MVVTYSDLDVESDFGGEFPYRSKRLDVGGGVKMAYVDEGPRNAPLTFLLVHGNPTWGFVYRRFIDRLWNRYRVVVPDHVGFGRSDKPQDPDYYSLERHIRNLQRLVEALKLQNVVLVVHDWGGPIGFGAATRLPQPFKGFVVLNSWAFVQKPKMQLPWLFKRLVRSGGGWKRITKRNFFTEVLLGRLGTTRPLARHELDAYRAAHPRPEDRIGIARFPQLIPESHDVSHESWSTMKTIEDRLFQFQDLPCLIAWAMKDPAFRKPYLERWQQIFPRHGQPLLLAEAKHFLQEDAAGEILQAIQRFAHKLAPTPRPSAPIVVSARPSRTVAPIRGTPMANPTAAASTKPPPPRVVPITLPAVPTKPVSSAGPAPRETAAAAPVVTPAPPKASPPEVPPAQNGDAPAPSHLVENGDAKRVKRVPKRNASGGNDQKPRVAKPRVVGSKDGAVAVKRTQRSR